MKIVAGLGNPGRRYRGTRHNTGFRVVEALAGEEGGAFEVSRFEGLTARVRLEGEASVLLKPTTYMNLSGRSVSRLARFYKVGAGDILVVLDDMDLPLGRLRLRPGGGSGGHKGLASVLRELGREDLPRLRVGIGRGEDATDHVLDRFGDEEQEAVDRAVGRACRAVRSWASHGVETAMNRFNGAVDLEDGQSRRKDDDEKEPGN